MHIDFKYAVAASLFVAGATASAAALAASVDLAAHRAVYDVSLLDTGEGVDIVNMSGRLVMELTGSPCTGFTSKLRFVTRTLSGEGDTYVMDSRSETFESADGRTLDFDTKVYSGPILSEETLGSASRGDQGVTVALQKPEERSLAIDGPMVFPTDQLARIIQAAQEGQAFLSMEVYDGSEGGDTVFETAGVIGPVHGGDNDDAQIVDAQISDIASWRVTLSYFDRSNNLEETPFYVLTFTLYENGIGRDMRIDYGDFALAGKLTALELFPSAPCP